MATVRTDAHDAAAIATFGERTKRALVRLGGVRELEVGWSIRTPDLRASWSGNHLCCTRASDRATLERMCDEVMADLTYRHLVVEHRATADALEPQLRAGGWSVERDVVMHLEGNPEPARDPRVVGELTEDQMVELMLAWLREEHLGVRDEDAADVGEFSRRVGRVWGERRLGVVASDGAPLAVTKLRIDGTLGWVEDVYTVPGARGNGFATALVTTAARGARDAGCTDVIIVADADDWPQHLYAKLGFRPIGSARVFHRVVG